MITRALSAIGWRWRCHRASVSARRDSLANLAVRPIRRLLVVCYGNICRSPFVATYLRQTVGDRLEVRSGGFHVRPGRASPERHIVMSRTRGIDLSGHVSSVVCPADLAWADIIVLMDRHNWQALQLARAPTEALVWLGALDDGPVDIPDPYALDEQQAGDVLCRLEECSIRLAAALALPPGTGGQTLGVNRATSGGATPGA